MYSSNRLKTDALIFPFILSLAAVVVLVGFFVSGLLSEKALHIGETIVFSIAALLFLLALIRIKNMNYVIFFLFYLNSALLNYFQAIRYELLIKPLAVLIFPVALIFFYKLFSKAMQPHYRQILELAAKPVHEVADGFTSRPYPAGEAEYTREEVIRFAQFLTKHCIAVGYIEADRVVLVISGYEFKYLFFIKPDFQKKTYVSFDFSGNISVNIAKREYEKYKDELTFDKLCESLGSLFTTFLDHYRRGESKKIIDIIFNEMSRSHGFFRIFSNRQQHDIQLDKGE